jgi:hypothetical protein
MLGLYKLCVSRTIDGVKQVTVVEKWEHEFTAMDLLLAHWMREETAEIWDGDYDSNKKCNMHGATYATAQEIRESGRKEDDDILSSPLSPLPDEISWLEEKAQVEVGGSAENKSIGNGAADFASATADAEEDKDMVSAICSTL